MSKCAENSSFSRKWNSHCDMSDGGAEGVFLRVLREQHHHQ